MIDDTTGAPEIDLPLGESEETESQAAESLAHRRGTIQRRVGQVALAIARIGRYRQLAIADFDALVLQPLLQNRALFFHGDKDSADTPIGIALWASVSQSVSDRIAAECDSGTFPVRLAPDEWASGDQIWLLDIIVPNRQAGTALFRMFGRVVDGRSFRMHPVVLSSVDPELVGQLREAVDAIAGGREAADDQPA